MIVRIAWVSLISACRSDIGARPIRCRYLPENIRAHAIRESSESASCGSTGVPGWWYSGPAQAGGKTRRPRTAWSPPCRAMTSASTRRVACRSSALCSAPVSATNSPRIRRPASIASRPRFGEPDASSPGVLRVDLLPQPAALPEVSDRFGRGLLGDLQAFGEIGDPSGHSRSGAGRARHPRIAGRRSRRRPICAAPRRPMPPGDEREQPQVQIVNGDRVVGHLRHQPFVSCTSGIPSMTSRWSNAMRAGRGPSERERVWQLVAAPARPLGWDPATIFPRRSRRPARRPAAARSVPAVLVPSRGHGRRSAAHGMAAGAPACGAGGGGELVDGRRPAPSPPRRIRRAGRGGLP